MGSLRHSEDDTHEVLAAVVEKLGGRGARSLKLYGGWRERHPEKTFADWIRIVTKNVIRDHVRAVLGESKQTAVDRDPSVKRVLNEFASSQAWEQTGIRPPMTLAQTSRQLL